LLSKLKKAALGNQSGFFINFKLNTMSLFRTLEIPIFEVKGSNKNKYVLLLHGLARTKRSMSKLEETLSKQGYHIINIGYPSTRIDIETLAEKTISKALEQCPDNAEINFVTHSMGGILVRQYLANHNIKNLNHVVMLGPPNKGSEIVDKLGDWWLFKLINGPAGQQLGTDKDSIPNQLGTAKFTVGIIAGTTSFNPLLSWLMPKPHDGKVTLESSKLEGMADHICLPVTHTFMMNKASVIEQTIHFLQHGYFTPVLDQG
jgi:pimeloyl-ACP methyl ester carboxylesterase